MSRNELSQAYQEALHKRELDVFGRQVDETTVSVYAFQVSLPSLPLTRVTTNALHKVAAEIREENARTLVTLTHDRLGWEMIEALVMDYAPEHPVGVVALAYGTHKRPPGWTACVADAGSETKLTPDEYRTHLQLWFAEVCQWEHEQKEAKLTLVEALREKSLPLNQMRERLGKLINELNNPLDDLDAHDHLCNYVDSPDFCSGELAFGFAQNILIVLEGLKAWKEGRL